MKSVPEEPQNTVKFSALWLSIGIAGFLTVLKIVTGVMTHSLGLIASAVDSLLDVLASSINLIAAREASKPADAEHLYGHGKIESLAGLFQSVFILASGLYLMVAAVRRLQSGVELTYLYSGVAVMVVSMLLTFLLILRLKHAMNQTKSIILDAETLHYTTDFLTNGAVIGALLLVKFTGSSVWDVIVTCGIAGYILTQSIRILRKSVDELLDRALPTEEHKKN